MYSANKGNKMKLNYRNIKCVEVNDWDDLIKEVYKKPFYGFQQQDGCKDRGTYRFSVPLVLPTPEDFEEDEIPVEVNGEDMGVSFKAWLERDEPFFSDDYDEELFWERNFYPHIDMLIQDLYNKGILEEGEYLINIDWR